MADSDKTTEKVTRRHPSRISRLVERKEPQIISEAHKNWYGFEVSERFANDLAAYVKDPAKMPPMLASGNPQEVIETIRDIYGVRVTRDYAVDLLAFAEKGEQPDK